MYNELVGKKISAVVRRYSAGGFTLYFDDGTMLSISTSGSRDDRVVMKMYDVASDVMCAWVAETIGKMRVTSHTVYSHLR